MERQPAGQKHGDCHADGIALMHTGIAGLGLKDAPVHDTCTCGGPKMVPLQKTASSGIIALLASHERHAMKPFLLVPAGSLLLPALLAAAGCASPPPTAPKKTAMILNKTLPDAVQKVTPAVAGRVQAFDLDQVTLLPGPFQAAMQRDHDYLMSLEPDRLLHNFRTEAGLPAKAPIYGGWENSGVAGHILGHYLSALSLYYRATGDPVIKKRIDYIVDELALCQDKNGGGYVSAIPGGKAMFADVAAGHGNGVHRGWVPWYTMHKLLAGCATLIFTRATRKPATC